VEFRDSNKKKTKEEFAGIDFWGKTLRLLHAYIEGLSKKNPDESRRRFSQQGKKKSGGATLPEKG